MAAATCSFAMSFNERSQSLQTDRSVVSRPLCATRRPPATSSSSNTRARCSRPATSPGTLGLGGLLPGPCRRSSRMLSGRAGVRYRNDITTLFGVTDATPKPEHNDKSVRAASSFFNALHKAVWGASRASTSQPLRYKRTADGGAAGELHRLLPDPCRCERYNMFTRGNYETQRLDRRCSARRLYSNVTHRHPQPGRRDRQRLGRVTCLTRHRASIPATTASHDARSDDHGAQTINVNGYGNPSSVVLNQDGFGGLCATYTDPTPGDLTDNPTNPAFAALGANSSNAAAGGLRPARAGRTHLGGCSNWRGDRPVPPRQPPAALNARRPSSVRTPTPGSAELRHSGAAYGVHRWSTRST